MKRTRHISLFGRDEKMKTHDTKSTDTIYGKDIHILPKNEKGVPLFLPLVCEEIIKQANTKGIFRICGDHMIVQELGKAALSPNFWVPKCSVHDLASFLKQWLRALPKPIINPDLINQLYGDGNENNILDILGVLDPLDRKCIAIIFATVQIVVDQAAINQMTFSNIEICFKPSFMQNGCGILSKFNFKLFFDVCIRHMNPDGDDIQFFID